MGTWPLRLSGRLLAQRPNVCTGIPPPGASDRTQAFQRPPGWRRGRVRRGDRLIAFRPLRRADFELLGGWLAEPVVLRWWKGRGPPGSCCRTRASRRPSQCSAASPRSAASVTMGRCGWSAMTNAAPASRSATPSPQRLARARSTERSARRRACTRQSPPTSTCPRSRAVAPRARRSTGRCMRTGRWFGSSRCAGPSSPSRATCSQRSGEVRRLGWPPSSRRGWPRRSRPTGWPATGRGGYGRPAPRSSNGCARRPRPRSSCELNCRPSTSAWSSRPARPMAGGSRSRPACCRPWPPAAPSSAA